MVTVLLALAVVLPICGSTLVGLRWFLDEKAKAHGRTASDEIEARLVRLEADLKARGMAKAFAR